jgi:hypothetical protein
LQFENTLKLQSLLVIRRICSAANKVAYIGSLLDVALDLWKPTPIQDNQQFIDLCWVIVEEVMGQQTFSEVLLEILTETFVNIASFFYKSCFDLADGEHFQDAYLYFFAMSTEVMRFFPKFFPNAETMCDFKFPSLQNDHDNEELWDVERCSNFAELVMYAQTLRSHWPRRAKQR